MAQNTVETLNNSTVYAQDGDKIGKVSAVYLDAQTSQPTFVAVSTGLFGSNVTFVPLNETRLNGEELTVPYTKEFVKDAPNIAEDGELSTAEEQNLYNYYSLDSSYAGVSDYGTVETATGTATTDAEYRRANATAGRETADRHTATDVDGNVTAHEERLNVSTETTARETGKLRLRKHVTSHTETVEVPVRREEIVVERVPVDGEKVVDGYDFDGKDANVDVTVTAHEERPVVSKETVATESVNVSKEVHNDTETVSGEVRKETIEIDGDKNNRR